MPKYLVLPKIGLNMEEGVISEWLIKPGDKVEKEQMVVRAETDKAVQDIFATESGIVYKLLVQPGDVVPCQEKIAVLLDEGEEYTEQQEPEEAKTKTDLSISKSEEKKHILEKNIQKKHRAIRISPLARKMAKDFGIPEEQLRPEREGKRIVKADVLRIQQEIRTASKQSDSLEEEYFVPFSNIRKTIARKMLHSEQNKPRVTLVATVDCEKLKALREKLKLQAKVGYNEIIAKACACALKKYPEMNCVTEDGGYRVKKSVNVGIAADTSKGLLVPVLKNVEKKGIFELAEEFQSLLEKARAGTLSSEEMSGGTFSISNVGMFDIDFFNPIINEPECLILGVGCMKECPVVLEHEIKIRLCMKVSLSFDHAVFDGATASRLLKTIKEFLEEPVLMLG